MPRIGAVMTTRHGGIGLPPFDSLNLRFEIGDAPAAVAHNQRLLAESIGATPVFLRQVHGAAVASLGEADIAPGALVYEADASVTTRPGIACAVQVADCLPVLFAAPNARAVGAAHAGWRGLAAGVLEATLAAVCDAVGCVPGEVQAWLGPCIGPTRFEVGAEVLQAFGVAAPQGSSPHFARLETASPDGRPKWLADLAGLARGRLRAAGVESISGGIWCTASDASRFFSFRRDGVTGRMVAAIWIEPGPIAV